MEHEAQGAAFDQIDDRPWEVSGISPLETARDICANIKPPAGRGSLTIPAQLALAQTLATIALVEAQEVANALQAIRVGIPSATEANPVRSAVAKTEERRVKLNRLKAVARRGLGL